MENLDFSKLGQAMECYESVNKGRMCKVPLLSE